MAGYYGNGQNYGPRHVQYAHFAPGEQEEMVDLNGYRSPRNLDNTYDYSFQDGPASPAPVSPRPVAPYRPGLQKRYSPPDYNASSGWLTTQTPRSSRGPESFAESPYDSRAASPTMVSNYSEPPQLPPLPQQPIV